MRSFCVMFVLLLFTGCAFAQTAPSDIAGKILTKDSSIDDVLDALDARAQGLKTFTGKVKLSVTATDIANTTTQSGKIWYQDLGDGQARVRVTFDTMQKNEGKPVDDKVEYVLGDGKVIERYYKDKKQTTSQVLRPGEKMNLLKLGEGPFPLPIGQPKETVHQQFDVKKKEAATDDPPGTVHIQLAPKDDTKFARQFKTIDVWVDVKSHIPVRIATRDPNETSDRATELEIQINTPVNDRDFDLDKIDPNTWNVTQQSFQN